MRFKSVLVIVAVLLASLGGTVQVLAQDATPDAVDSALAALGLPELNITVTDDHFDVPGVVPAGQTLITLKNIGHDSRASFLLRFPETMTIADIFAGVPDGDQPPAWLFTSTLVGFPGETLPGATNRAVVDLTPGLYLILDDFSQPFFVLPAGSNDGTSSAIEPTADGEVSLFEYSFKFPETISAGQQIWKITNAGRENHELLLVSVPDGTSVDQVTQYFTSESDASPVAGLSRENVAPVGGLGWLSAGGIAWTEVNLPPGTYAALCFAVGPDFVDHVMRGMVAVFTVS